MATSELGKIRVVNKPVVSPVDEWITRVVTNINELYAIHDEVTLTKDPEGFKTLRSLEHAVADTISEIGVAAPTKALKLWKQYLEFQSHLNADLGYQGRILYRNA